MFERTELVVGKENIKKIKDTKVLIIGLGGVGGYAFESLLRIGIGTIIIVDNDKYDETNLNRQLHATKNTIGEYKVDILENYAKEINNTKIVKIKKFITEDNLNELFKYDIDYIVDAEDTMSTKKALIKNCLEKNINIVSVMGMGGKIDAGKVKLMDIKNTSYDPIAKEIRKLVKELKTNQKLMVISSDEKAIKSNPIGSVSYVPAIAGLLCTNYIINDIISKNKC